MFKVFNEIYYLDLDEIEKYVQIEPNDKTENDSENQFSIVKYEMIKLMVTIILDDYEEVDEKLGRNTANNLTPSFKLAFNTLLRKGLVKHY
jgi:hypothetical protein